MLQSRHSLTMAPKRRRAHPAPNGKRQHSEAGASAAAEPPLAVANHPQRLIQFHRSEDDKVFVELTTLWRWLSGNLNSTQGERRLAMTLRRSGYNGAKFTAQRMAPASLSMSSSPLQPTRRFIPWRMRRRYGISSRSSTKMSSTKIAI